MIKATLSLLRGFRDESLFHGDRWFISMALGKQDRALCGLHSHGVLPRRHILFSIPARIQLLRACQSLLLWKALCQRSPYHIMTPAQKPAMTPYHQQGKAPNSELPLRPSKPHYRPHSPSHLLPQPCGLPTVSGKYQFIIWFEKYNVYLIQFRCHYTQGMKY